MCLFLISEQIAANIALEIKRMQRRKQLILAGGCSPPQGCSSPPHDSLHSCSSAASPTFFNALSPGKKETPLFTFRQVSLVCERMMKEREDQIRQQYDKVLTSKLAGMSCHVETNWSFLCNSLLTSSVHENHLTYQTFPMARPKCLMRDFTNLNRIYKSHWTNVWWIMEVFQLHWTRCIFSGKVVAWVVMSVHLN